MRKIIYVILKENLQTGIANIYVTIVGRKDYCLNYINTKNFMEGDKFHYYYKTVKIVV